MTRLPLLFCLLLAVIPARADFSAPEILNEFVNAWVEYDKGHYAAALRSFARVHNMDPRFGPSIDGIRASLIQMDMPEVADSLRGWGNGFVHEIEYQPELAFWGVYHDDQYSFPGVSRIENQIHQFLIDNVNYPIRRVSPGSQYWQDRQDMAPCQYNLMVMLAPDEEPNYIRARFHLITALDVSTNQSVDIIANAPGKPWIYTHRTWMLRLSKTDLAASLDTEIAGNELRSLITGEFPTPPAPFIADEETLALPDFSELKDCWELYSKAAVSENPQLDWLLDAWHSGGGHEGPITRLRGFPRWLLRRNPEVANHRDWPWVVFYSTYDSTVSFYKRDHYDLFTEDYIREHFADHPVGKIQRINDLGLQINQENRAALATEMAQLIAELNKDRGKSGSEYGTIETLTNEMKLLEHWQGNPVEFTAYPQFPLYMTFRYHRELGTKKQLLVKPRYNRYFFPYTQLDKRDDQGPARVARDADIILEINPYISGDLNQFIARQQAMLLETPDSRFLNGLTNYLNKLHYQAHEEPIDPQFYAEHAARMIDMGANWRSVFDAIQGLRFTDEQRAIVARAMNERLLRGDFKNPDDEVEAFSSLIGGATSMSLRDLSLEALAAYDLLCEPYTVSTNSSRNDRYFIILHQRHRIEKYDYVRDSILKRLPEAHATMAAQAPSIRTSTAFRLATLLIAAGEYETSGEIIARYLSQTDLNELNTESQQEHFWFNTQLIEAERLHYLGRQAEALAVIDNALPLMGERKIQSISKSSPYKGPVSFHLLELKKAILAEQHAARQ